MAAILDFVKFDIFPQSKLWQTLFFFEVLILRDSNPLQNLFWQFCWISFIYLLDYLREQVTDNSELTKMWLTTLIKLTEL